MQSEGLDLNANLHEFGETASVSPRMNILSPQLHTITQESSTVMNQSKQDLSDEHTRIIARRVLQQSQFTNDTQEASNPVNLGSPSRRPDLGKLDRFGSQW